MTVFLLAVYPSMFYEIKQAAISFGFHGISLNPRPILTQGVWIVTLLTFYGGNTWAFLAKHRVFIGVHEPREIVIQTRSIAHYLFSTMKITPWNSVSRFLPASSVCRDMSSYLELFRITNVPCATSGTLKIQINCFNRILIFELINEFSIFLHFTKTFFLHF